MSRTPERRTPAHERRRRAGSRVRWWTCWAPRSCLDPRAERTAPPVRRARARARAEDRAGSSLPSPSRKTTISASDDVDAGDAGAPVAAARLENDACSRCVRHFARAVRRATVDDDDLVDDAVRELSQDTRQRRDLVQGRDHGDDARDDGSGQARRSSAWRPHETERAPTRRRARRSPARTHHGSRSSVESEDVEERQRAREPEPRGRGRDDEEREQPRARTTAGRNAVVSTRPPSTSSHERATCSTRVVRAERRRRRRWRAGPRGGRSSPVPPIPREAQQPPGERAEILPVRRTGRSADDLRPGRGVREVTRRRSPASASGDEAPPAPARERRDEQDRPELDERPERRRRARRARADASAHAASRAGAREHGERVDVAVRGDLADRERMPRERRRRARAAAARRRSASRSRRTASGLCERGTARSSRADPFPKRPRSRKERRLRAGRVDGLASPCG